MNPCSDGRHLLDDLIPTIRSATSKSIEATVHFGLGGATRLKVCRKCQQVFAVKEDYETTS